MLEKNECDSSDMLDIIKYLYKYVPWNKKLGIPVPVLVGGDLLTVERMLHAIEDVRNSVTNKSRLEGVIPVLEDFHTLGNYLEVM